jgi:hypothetical protein
MEEMSRADFSSGFSTNEQVHQLRPSAGEPRSATPESQANRLRSGQSVEADRVAPTERPVRRERSAPDH